MTSAVTWQPMATARRLQALCDVGWQLVTGAAIAIGFAAALSSSAGAIVAVWLIVSMIATISWILRDLGDEADLRPAVLVGTQIGVVAVASVGLIQLLDVAALAIIGGLTVTSPQLLGRLEKRWRNPFSPRTSSGAGPVALPSRRDRVIDPPSDYDLLVTDRLTDDDLCLAWRSSYVALSRAATTEARVLAAEVRAVILDELDRRNGEGLRAWLDSGARAASDPRPHLSEPRG